MFALVYSRWFYTRRELCICVCVLLAAGILFTEPMKAFYHQAIEYTSRTEPANLNIMTPTLYPSQTRTWVTENQKTTYALMGCMNEPSACGQNQTKVVIVTSPEFIQIMQGGPIRSETIWAYSTRLALNNMGYSVLFSPDMERALQLYHIFHDLVKSVISFPSQVNDCWDNAECVRTSENPSGIPAWKLFSFYFWHEVQNPLGAKWTLSPEDYQLQGYAPNNYVGYSIEFPLPLGLADDHIFVISFCVDSARTFLPRSRERGESMVVDQNVCLPNSRVILLGKSRCHSGSPAQGFRCNSPSKYHQKKSRATIVLLKLSLGSSSRTTEVVVELVPWFKKCGKILLDVNNDQGTLRGISCILQGPRLLLNIPTSFLDGVKNFGHITV
ncbi:hypothetical protein C8R44DRAFT_732200 [Mycena epipterygia]|nr:hypothetical protein C8R44DRAFT_732200 [Mycena epipterygia]